MRSSGPNPTQGRENLEVTLGCSNLCLLFSATDFPQLLGKFHCVTNLIVTMWSASSSHEVLPRESHTNSHQLSQYLTCKEADISCFCIKLMLVLDNTLSSPTKLSSVETFKSFFYLLDYSVTDGGN